MGDRYRNNHYVPKWYQKRFLLQGQKEMFYLNLFPDIFCDSRGVRHTDKALKQQGPSSCFVERDLYTRKFRNITSTEIEKTLFGNIDTKGSAAVDYFTDFSYPLKPWGTSLEDLMRYMSIQKLRTPKGLEWLRYKSGATDKNTILALMVRLRDIYGAIWMECVWQIADATRSETKFILSDHPVTVYNRRCSPKSSWCRGVNDPDIWLQATHTIFPLSIEKILILTNLSWVRNPYQSETGLRPNPNPFRNAIFKFTDIQLERHLSEQEVIEINHVIKKRAYRYIAAAKEEWLYPERYIPPNQHWHNFGNGYLLMPDPRPIHWGGTIMWGGGPGGPGAMDEYGRLPGDPDFERGDAREREYKTLPWFKGEFAAMVGPYRRGRDASVMMNDLGPERDTEEHHQYHLSLRRKTYKERIAELKRSKESTTDQERE